MRYKYIAKKQGDLVRSDIIHFKDQAYYAIHKNYKAGLGYRVGIILEIESKEKFEEEFRRHKRAGRICQEALVQWSDGSTSSVGLDTIRKVQ